MKLSSIVLSIVIGYLLGVSCGWSIYFCSFIKNKFIRFASYVASVLAVTTCIMLIGLEIKLICLITLINAILTLIILAIVKASSERREDTFASGT